MEKKKALLKVILFSFILSAIFFPWSQTNLWAEQKEDLFNMSIEELMNVDVGSSSLTKATCKEQTPAAVAVTGKQMAASAARILAELLDIYIPNQHPQLGDALGIGSIIPEMDNELMNLVNRREINPTPQGTTGEGDKPKLTGKNGIGAVQGPGASLYGAGMLTMIINVVAKGSDVLKDSQAIDKEAGESKEFYPAEYKLGGDFQYAGGLFGFEGISRYLNTKKDYLGKAASFLNNPDANVSGNRSYKNKPGYIVDYGRRNFDFWARYRTGQGAFWWPYITGYFNLPGWRRLSLTGKYTYEFDSIFGYDSPDYGQWSDGDSYVYSEEEVLLK
jgi:hypothetical protein